MEESFQSRNESKTRLVDRKEFGRDGLEICFGTIDQRTWKLFIVLNLENMMLSNNMKSLKQNKTHYYNNLNKYTYLLQNAFVIVRVTECIVWLKIEIQLVFHYIVELTLFESILKVEFYEYYSRNWCIFHYNFYSLKRGEKIPENIIAILTILYKCILYIHISVNYRMLHFFYTFSLIYLIYVKL